jgi:hypothetical protein
LVKLNQLKQNQDETAFSEAKTELKKFLLSQFQIDKMDDIKNINRIVLPVIENEFKIIVITKPSNLEDRSIDKKWQAQCFVFCESMATTEDDHITCSYLSTILMS